MWYGEDLNKEKKLLENEEWKVNSGVKKEMVDALIVDQKSILDAALSKLKENNDWSYHFEKEDTGRGLLKIYISPNGVEANKVSPIRIVIKKDGTFNFRIELNQTQNSHPFTETDVSLEKMEFYLTNISDLLKGKNPQECLGTDKIIENANNAPETKDVDTNFFKRRTYRSSHPEDFIWNLSKEKIRKYNLELSEYFWVNNPWFVHTIHSDNGYGFISLDNWIYFMFNSNELDIKKWDKVKFVLDEKWDVTLL